MAEGARLESVYTGNCIQGSNPCLSASFQCIIRGRPASEGGSSFWRSRSVSPRSNRKTERSGCAVARECWARPSDGGFAPVPPGFSALLPDPMRGLSQYVNENGMRAGARRVLLDVS